MEKTGRRKSIILAIIAGCFILAGIAVNIILVRTKPVPAGIAGKPEPLRVGTVVVKPTEITNYIEGYGIVESLRKTQITSQVSGRIIYRSDKAYAGNSVETHEMIFKIDPRDYQYRLQELRAQIDAGEAQLQELNVNKQSLQRQIKITSRREEIAQKEYERTLELYRDNTAAIRELDLKESAWRQAQQNLEQLKMNLSTIDPKRKALKARIKSLESRAKLAELNLQRTTVEAPFTGGILSVNAEIGQMVSPGFVLATLIDTGRIEIPAQLEASLRSQVSAGDRAVVVTTGPAPKQYDARVVRIDPQIDPTRRVFNAYLIPTDHEDSAKPLPGSFVNVSIKGSTYHSAIVIPRSAIRNDHVFLVHKNQAIKQAVRVRQYIKEHAVIESGLKPGQQVIITNLDVVREGSKVRPVQRSLPAIQTRPSGAAANVRTPKNDNTD